MRAGAGRLTTRARPRGISMIKMTIALFKQFKQSEGGGGNGWDMPPKRCLQHWPGPGREQSRTRGDGEKTFRLDNMDPDEGSDKN